MDQMEELSDGVYKLDDLPYGDYTLKETEAPKGFLLDEKTYSFSVKENGKTVIVETEAGKGFVNQAQTGGIRIEKTSEDGVLKGFTFRVEGTDITGNAFSKDFVTDEKGQIHIDGLHIGDYVISEVYNKANEKYELPTNVTVTVHEGKTVVAKFHNKLKPVTDIPKTGDTTNMPLWAALTGISAIGAGAAAFFTFRKKKEVGKHERYHSVVLKPSETQKEMVASLSERAERVRNKMVDSSVDNMLLITNDGRKLALDQRLMNDMLPDSETSKVGACAENVFDIWQRTADRKSTQMVFCDLSTPHGDGKFNVYDDLRNKLIAKGVPAEEIAYIHTANSEAQKKELFGKVRSGQVRVLIGSTQKMGAGTNVQTKLAALHHLDCPWRPSDLQQREGRIIRQGNENKEVDIYTYVTENTFDSYLYQLVESKQKFIGQIMTSKSPVRSAEDIDETALSYAEIKALCAGNPHIKEKMDLDIDVSRLKLLKANHLSQRYALEDQIIKEFPQKIRSLEQRIEGYRADIDQRKRNTEPNEDGFSPMIMLGGTVREKKAAGDAILGLCKSMTSPNPIPIGQYRGFDMELSFDTFSREYKITLIHQLRHTVTLGTDIFGNIQRLDNTLSAFEERMAACAEQLENTRVQLENAKAEVQKPFPQEEELKTKSARLNELNAMLNLDKRENEIVDGERGEEEPQKASADRER